MLVWWIVSPAEVQQPPWLRRGTTFVEESSRGWIRTLQRRSSQLRNRTEDLITNLIIRIYGIFPVKGPKNQDEVENYVRRNFDYFRNLTLQQRCELFFFRPMEMFNTCWLIYIVLAQTFGIYKNCACSCSLWAGGGGYMDFLQSDTTDSPWVRYYWSAGTALSVGAMGFAIIYITLEWNLQSFLTAEDYAAAMRGLQRTRHYRSLTMPFRIVTRTVIKTIALFFDSIARLFGFTRREQRSLRWTKNVTYQTSGSRFRDSDDRHELLFPQLNRARTESNPIEMQHYEALENPLQVVTTNDSPYMPISRFPAPVYRNHPHQLHSSQRLYHESDSLSNVPLINQERGWLTENMFEETPRISQESIPAVAPDDRSGSFSHPSLLSPTVTVESPLGITMRQTYSRQLSDGGSHHSSRSPSGLGISTEAEASEGHPG
jgi:hypothetical protein